MGYWFPGLRIGITCRIMEPLFTTRTQGIGLGLAITRAILDKNKGSLDLESEPGNGSTFTVSLRRHSSRVSRPNMSEGSM